MKSKLTFLAVLLLLLSSCIPQKRIKYLQDKSGQDTTSSYALAYSKEYRLQTGDNLYIRVLSMDERTNGLFNLVQNNQSNFTSGGDAGLFLTSYTLDVNGYIRMPVLGSVYLRDKSLEEAKSIIQESVNEYLKGSTVIVKLVSFYYTVLGEVKRPGRYPVYQSRMNLFEALGEAGDLTTFSNRNKVKLVRENGEKTEVIKLDLTDSRILASEYYYLKPNDILYVEPLKGKGFAFEAFPYSLIFSTITTTLLILNFTK